MKFSSENPFEEHEQLSIFLLTTDETLCQTLQGFWSSEHVRWRVFTSGRALLEKVFTEPPQILICSEESDDIGGIDVIGTVKSENIFMKICAVLILSRDTLQNVQLTDLRIDDFLLCPFDVLGAKARLEFALQRFSSVLDANPLTHLPGNTSIMHTVDRYLVEKTPIAFAYLDIDNFKAFNDKYGFSRGDEVLLVTARLLVSTVMGMDAPHKFVGHIGGDDFFFLTPPDVMEEACKHLTTVYDSLIPTFYDDDDKERGGIESHDRQGNVSEYPFMSISIGITINKDGCYSHYGEISQSLGQLKKHAKTTQGSCYVFDRRKK